jgi:hypothetical protein
VAAVKLHGLTHAPEGFSELLLLLREHVLLERYRVNVIFFAL